MTYTLTGNWSIYAEASPDSGGIFSYSAGLRGIVPVSGQNAAPGIYAWNTSTGQVRQFGFTGPGGAGGLGGSGSQNPNAVPYTPVYGFGQEAGDLDNLRPPGFTDTSGIVGIGGQPYQKKLLLVSGSGDRGCPFWAGGSARVFVDRSSAQTVEATIRYRMVNACSQPAMALGVALPQFTGNVAQGGVLRAGEVNELTRNDSTGGGPIAGIGDDAGSIYVMAKLLGEPRWVDMIANSLVARVDPSDPEAQRLHALYDQSFGAGGFDALLRYDNRPGAKVVYWGFEPSIGVTVDKLAVVPEPQVVASLAVCALLISRRRH